MATVQKPPTQGTTEDQKRFLELLRKFDTAMLITHTPEGRAHARPMAVADVSENGDVWFATRLHTLKTSEIQHDQRVLVVLQDGSKFLSLSGRAQIHKDPQRVQQLWSEAWRLWFKDKSDPSLGLIQVIPEEAEYWDQSGPEAIKYMLRAAAAYVGGRQLPGSETDPNQHGKVRM
jgi:general stress protein 26